MHCRKGFSILVGWRTALIELFQCKIKYWFSSHCDLIINCCYYLFLCTALVVTCFTIRAFNFYNYVKSAT